MKPIYLLALFFTLSLLSVGLVSAVECNADLSQGGDSCTVSSSLTLNGSYNVNMNGSNNGAVISISASNIIFDCNGTTIYGNKTLGSLGTNARGIQNTEYNNITIKNCILNYFGTSIYTRHHNNFNVNNVTVLNSGSVDFQNMTNSSYTNSNSINSSVYGGETSGNNIYFSNLTCLNSGSNPISGLTFGFTAPSLSNSLIENINLTNCGRFTLPNPQNVTINNLNIFGSNYSLGFAIDVYSDSLMDNSIILKNSFISSVDIGMRTKNITNLILDNVTFYNITLNRDTYESAFHSQEHTDNLTIINCNFTGFQTGLLLRSVTHFNISNNHFSNPSNIIDYFPLDITLGEPITAIFFQEIYKGFIPVGTQSWYAYAQASPYNSSNGVIYGNTFDNIPVLLRGQGLTNVTQDLTNYYFKSFQFPFYADRDDLWISNDWNNASTIRNNQYNNLLYYGIINNWTSNFSLNKNFDYFLNTQPVSKVLIVNNLTSALLTNGTSLCNGSTGLMTGQVNITLNPNEACWVLDNLNLTEGVTREYSPLAITQKTTSSLHITNSMDSELDNLVVLVNIGSNCNDIGKFTYTSDSGLVQTFNKGDFTCNGDYAVMTINNIEPSLTSNELDWTYGCSPFEQTGYRIILIAGGLMLLGGVFYYLFSQGIMGEITVGKLIIVFIIIVVSIGLLIASADNIAGVCVI